MNLTIQLLETIANAQILLSSYAYTTYLKTQASSWDSRVVFTGGIPLRHEQTRLERFVDRGLSIGSNVSFSDNVSIIWSVEIQWQENEWVVAANVGLEDLEDRIDDCPIGKAQCNTIEECIALIHRSIDLLREFDYSKFIRRE